MRRIVLGLVVLGCGESGGGMDTDASTTAFASASASASASGSGTTAPSSTTATSDDTASSGSGVDASSDGGSSSTGEIPGTAGCGAAAADPTQMWIQHDIDVDGTARQYWVWLPEPYDPDRRYPIVYQLHGCSDGEDRQNNNPPVHEHSGADAIVIRGRAVESCWDSNPAGPDVAFFDALVADVEATWCADPARRLVAGYSSGSFMGHALACVRGDSIRGVATIAGGQPGTDCPGQVAALLIHDTDDQTVNISASESTRDALIARNHCDAAMPTTPVDPSPCQAYAGCDDGVPVVWCQTSGQDHSRQDELSAPAFWSFLSTLPPT